MKKILSFLLVGLLLALSASAATTYRYEDVVSTIRGDVIGGAAVTVYKANTTTLVSLYSGPTTSYTARTNPTSTDSYGRFYFYTLPGTYDVKVSGTNITTYTLEDVVLAAPRQEFNILDYGAVGGDGIDDYAAIQATIAAAAAAGAYGSGTVRLPAGDFSLATKLDIGYDQGVQFIGDNKGGTWLNALAGLDTSMLDIGITDKTNTTEVAHIRFNNELAPTLDAFIRVGDGRSLWLHDLDFRDENTGVDSFGADYSLLIDPELGSENVGCSHSVFERLSDSGSGCADTAMIKATYLVSSTIRDIRVSKNATWGVMLGGYNTCTGNLIENINPESGSATNTALVYIDHSAASSGSIRGNTVRLANDSGGLVDYGIYLVSDGSRVIWSNTFETRTAIYDTSAFNMVDDQTGIYLNTYNGLGYNAGDPGTTGQWNGEGYEGAQVYDTTNSELYKYLNGAWTKVMTAVGAESVQQTYNLPATSPSGEFYVGGFYTTPATNNDFQPGITYGTANSSYAAHFYVVTSTASATDTVRVVGTSITDAMVRTASDTAFIYIGAADTSGTYYETEKKWLGQIAVASVGGTAIQCNYGWAKYWDAGNSDFTVQGFEALWLGAKTHATFNIELLHHKNTLWEYGVGAVTVPPAIVDMSDVHDTEYEIIANEQGAFKCIPIGQAVAGSGSEGTLFRITTGTTNQLGGGQINMSVTK